MAYRLTCGAAGGKIEIYLGPKELGGPDNLEEAITGFLSGAKKTLDIAVQELDSAAMRSARAALSRRHPQRPWRAIAAADDCRRVEVRLLRQ